jgi:uncharacterized protein with von Willebrand factor type A (vWA) domain
MVAGDDGDDCAPVVLPHAAADITDSVMSAAMPRFLTREWLCRSDRAATLDRVSCDVLAPPPMHSVLPKPGLVRRNEQTFAG